jgi:hypothetical protein
MTPNAHMFRVACALAVAAALCVPTLAPAQDAPAAAAGTLVDNPLAHAVADEFAAGCEDMIATSMPDSIRQDAGKDASPALIAEMVAVGQAGMCGCFVDAIRRQPDAGLGVSVMEDMAPQFNACMAAALKPRMARICTETQRSGADDTAPDCACFADAVAGLDDDTLGAGANDLFDVLDSTREIPASAGALGEAARGCAARR